jgi:hypothetical protein
MSLASASAPDVHHKALAFAVCHAALAQSECSSWHAAHRHSASMRSARPLPMQRQLRSLPVKRAWPKLLAWPSRSVLLKRRSPSRRKKREKVR